MLYWRAVHAFGLSQVKHLNNIAVVSSSCGLVIRAEARGFEVPREAVVAAGAMILLFRRLSAV